jgi:hypothetical protein
MVKVRIPRDEPRFRDLRDKLFEDLDTSAYAIQVHKKIRKPWRGTFAYEVIYQIGDELRGAVGYRSKTLTYGFDKDEVYVKTENIENDNFESAKEDLLKRLASCDVPFL